MTFILSWIAAAGAHRVVVPGATRAWRAVLLSLFLLLLAGGVRFYATTAFMGMQFVPPAGEAWAKVLEVIGAKEPADYHRVSCLSMMEDMYTATEERLKAGAPWRPCLKWPTLEYCPYRWSVVQRIWNYRKHATMQNRRISLRGSQVLASSICSLHVHSLSPCACQLFGS